VDTETGAEHPFQIAGIKPSSLTETEPFPYGTITHDIPPGNYHLKIDNGIHKNLFATYQAKEKSVYTIKETDRTRPIIYTSFNLPHVPSAYIFKLRRGETFTLKEACLDHIEKLYLKKGNKSTTTKKFEVEKVSATYGEWAGLRFSMDASGRTRDGSSC